MCHPGQPAQGHPVGKILKSPFLLPALCCCRTHPISGTCCISPPSCPFQSLELLGTQRNVKISADENQTYFSLWFQKKDYISARSYPLVLSDWFRGMWFFGPPSARNKQNLLYTSVNVKGMISSVRESIFFCNQRTFFCPNVFFSLAHINFSP